MVVPSSQRQLVRLARWVAWRSMISGTLEAEPPSLLISKLDEFPPVLWRIIDRELPVKVPEIKPSGMVMGSTVPSGISKMMLGVLLTVSRAVVLSSRLLESRLTELLTRFPP